METLIGLVGGAASGGAGAGAGAGAAAGAAAPAMTGLAGMGPELAAGAVPAFSAGGGATAGAKGGGTTGLLGKMTKDISVKDAMDLMKIAASRQPGGAPGLPPMPSSGGGRGTQPSVQQFLQLLQQRPRPQLRLPG